MSLQVRDMFARISCGYDRANTILSAGIHHRWRKKAVRFSGAKTGDWVLDCATGTGDLAIEFKKVVGKTGRVIGTDFCAEMLQLAPGKAQAKNLELEWEIQDVMNLKYPDNTFDIASIAFGIRNVEDVRQALNSMARVVKPGGSVMILEFGTPKWWMKPFFALYSVLVIPVVGGIITGKADAYRYLTRTSAAFPTGESFLRLMKESGPFHDFRTIPLTGGIAYLYSGTVSR